MLCGSLRKGEATGKAEAKKMGNNMFLFLKNKLKLPINREKSGIRRPVNFKLLGYEFVPTYEKGTRGKYQVVVHFHRNYWYTIIGMKKAHSWMLCN